MSDEYKATAVLCSGGLDSAVLVAQAAREARVLPIFISVGFQWEAEERAALARLLAAPPFAGVIDPLVELAFDMRDVFAAGHWAVDGIPPEYDTPDEDVYLPGRNIILLSKAAVYLATARPDAVRDRARILMGQLAGNPFPDATPQFLEAMAGALSRGLDARIDVEMPFASKRKSEVVRIGAELGVPLELTLSCMRPAGGRHCGRCSKCRERRDAFAEAHVADRTTYATPPPR